ncbi:hypothetical protein E2C01_042858 [Portunus trituberculatus]|uniref:Uncharacterized protein n=1 Tax=Portunus trituberculatus TaxID=210409 RepID=A0A5B7FU43_PORTR|nr:hypothetical protein [Portunus trituberculatus]
MADADLHFLGSGADTGQGRPMAIANPIPVTLPKIPGAPGISLPILRIKPQEGIGGWLPGMEAVWQTPPSISQIGVWLPGHGNCIANTNLCIPGSGAAVGHGLSHTTPCSESVGLFNGEDYVFTSSNVALVDFAKLFLRYGWDVYRLQKVPASIIQDFIK